MGPSPRPKGSPIANPSAPDPTQIVSSTITEAVHAVDFNYEYLAKFLEVCLDRPNYDIKHHEIEISKVGSDRELFEKIWDMYNSSRGIGLQRFFLRPRDVHFVVVNSQILPVPDSNLGHSSFVSISILRLEPVS